MSYPLPSGRRLTFDEYMAFEMASEVRHEFVDGRAYAMSGASLPHGRIALNIAATLWHMAGDGPCHLYQEGAKLRIDDDIYYPDVMVVCEPSGEDELMAHVPCLLVEVLSPSTRRNDRSQKLLRYQSLPSLRTYLIVGRRYRRVERHWRPSADAPWQHEEITADMGRVPVPCPVPTVLTFGQIYRGVPAPDRPPVRRVRERRPAGTGKR